MAEIPHCSDISYNNKSFVTAISKYLLNFLVCMFVCNLCFVYSPEVANQMLLSTIGKTIF